MSIEKYDALWMSRVYRDLAISEEQIASGETRPAQEALADLRKKLGLFSSDIKRD
ncbi:hypothetical protein MOZ60_06310 [Stecheria sp. CLA-KB-P133]|uniref:Uncharacterized protein n=1 Tax=Grylomicrobium aquisgranensis TaxID=2926318 RepID=A0AB35U4P8_9FIRM|nr:hypothetical protein [Stecheria sp. CLA-KB-P133]